MAATHSNSQPHLIKVPCMRAQSVNLQRAFSSTSKSCFGLLAPCTEALGPLLVQQLLRVQL